MTFSADFVTAPRTKNSKQDVSRTLAAAVSLISKLLYMYALYPGHLVFFRHFYFSPHQVSGGFEFGRTIPMRWTTTGHMLCMEIRYTSPCIINAPHNGSSSYTDILLWKKKNTEHHHYHYDVYVCLGLNNTQFPNR